MIYIIYLRPPWDYIPPRPSPPATSLPAMHLKSASFRPGTRVRLIPGFAHLLPHLARSRAPIRPYNLSDLVRAFSTHSPRASGAPTYLYTQALPRGQPRGVINCRTAAKCRYYARGKGWRGLWSRAERLIASLAAPLSPHPVPPFTLVYTRWLPECVYPRATKELVRARAGISSCQDRVARAILFLFSGGNLVCRITSRWYHCSRNHASILDEKLGERGARDSGEAAIGRERRASRGDYGQSGGTERIERVYEEIYYRSYREC